MYHNHMARLDKWSVCCPWWCFSAGVHLRDAAERLVFCALYMPARQQGHVSGLVQLERRGMGPKCCGLRQLLLPRLLGLSCSASFAAGEVEERRRVGCGTFGNVVHGPWWACGGVGECNSPRPCPHATGCARHTGHEVNLPSWFSCFERCVQGLERLPGRGSGEVLAAAGCAPGCCQPLDSEARGAFHVQQVCPVLLCCV